jgi:hypothetical protein
MGKPDLMDHSNVPNHKAKLLTRTHKIDELNHGNGVCPRLLVLDDGSLDF